MSAVVAALPAAGDRAAAALLARAFRDNPINRAVFGPRPERRLRATRAGMEVFLPAVRRAGGSLMAARVAGAPVGVLAGVPSEAWPLPPPGPGALLSVWWHQGPRTVARLGRLAEELDALRPPGPHWILALLGVEPSVQRTGVGRALLGRLLAEADRSGRPVWLETDRSENVAFYAAAGFAVHETVVLEGVAVVRMVRGQ